ncbi:hypothetical protein ACA910_000855 [Epithemia clementina (nom. ined.)]
MLNTTLQRIRRGDRLSLSVRLLSSQTIRSSESRLPPDGVRFQDFATDHQGGDDHARAGLTSATNRSILSSEVSPTKAFHLKTYGCQMNVNDSDIVRSLLKGSGMRETLDETEADLLLTNTCAIREGAEAKVWQRLRELKAHRRKLPKANRRKVVIGVLGCMAERLKEDLFQDGMADLVVGPDAYRDLPRLIDDLWSDDIPLEQAVNVQLSLDETYADITPVRRNSDDISAFVSIQRGCANRCSFCIVPFTRGQERSRPLESIVDEIRRLVEEENIKEVTLLGQNVNSYHDKSEAALLARPNSAYTLSNDGFRSRIRRSEGGYHFADLVEQVSDLSPELRVRFTSPHPKDYPGVLLDLMSERHNVCNQLHMPAQSGSTTTLQRMKRGYSREAYLDLVLNEVIPRIGDVAISSDFIAGFCGETEDEHQDTLSLMEIIRYDQAFMFAYSMREKTHAHRTMQDDVPAEIKQRRLSEIIEVFHSKVHEKNSETEVGKFRCVLLEGESKRSTEGAKLWHGRTDQNKRIVFPVDDDVSCWTDDNVVQFLRGNNSCAELLSGPRVSLKTGDYAIVKVTEAKGHTLRGRLLWRTSLKGYSELGLMSEENLEWRVRLDEAINGYNLAAA